MHTHMQTHPSHTHSCTQEPFIIECVNFVASRAPKPITTGTVLSQEMVVLILSCIQPFVGYVDLSFRVGFLYLNVCVCYMYFAYLHVCVPFNVHIIR